MHDAHLGCALFFPDMLAAYTLLSLTVMVCSMSLVCSWNELGMSYVPVSSSPFCTRPFWWMPMFLLRKTSTIHIELLFRNKFMTWPFFGLVCRGHSWFYRRLSLENSRKKIRKGVPFGDKPRGPQDWKIQSREAKLKKSSFQYGMKFQSRMKFSFQAPLWPQKNRAWDRTFQSRMKFSNREWTFQARMKVACVGEPCQPILP